VALEQLKTYAWPGNVRELANVVQQMMVFCKGGDTITLHDLPPHLFARESDLREKREGRIQLSKMVADLEKKWILSKLKEAGWNQEKTASLLGITRKMLMDRLRKYEIKIPEKRGSVA
jgi:DNA-binding NtrC family response regulator